MKLEDSITGFEEILSGAVDHIPEQAFYMKGTIADVKAAAEKMKE